MTTAFYVTVTMVLGVAMLQISYCMAARAIWQILALRDVKALGRQILALRDVKALGPTTLVP